MSDRALGLALALILPLIFTIIGPYSVIDLAGWVAHGRYFLEHHELLRQDVFSVLPTEPLVYPSWGISVLYALIDRVGGLLAVCLFHSLVLAALLWILYRESLMKVPNPVGRKERYATYLCWLGSVAAFGERPSAVALLPLALSYLEISRIRGAADLTRARALKLCVIQIVWVNLHGSFILLPLMLAWKLGFLGVRKFGTLAAILACTFINPFTYRVYPFLLETMQKSRTRAISEWQPSLPWAHFPTGLLFWILSTGLLVWVVRRVRGPGSSRVLSSPYFFLVLNGFSAIRNAALPFVLLLPFLKEIGFLDSAATPELDRPKSANWMKLAFFFGLFVLATPFVKPSIARFLPPHRREVFDQTAPFEIARAIERSGETCPVFNTWDAGSFLMYRLPNRIFAEGRNILYSDQDIARYQKTLLAKSGWEKYLNDHRACFAVLDLTTDRALIEAMKRSSKWKPVLEEKGLVLLRKKPDRAALIRRSDQGASGACSEP